MDFTPYRYPRDPFPSDMPLPPAPPEAMEAYKKRLEYSQRIFDPWDASYAPPQPQTEDPGPSTNKKAQRAESSKPKHKKNDDIHPTSRDAQRNNVQGQIEQVQRVLVEPDRTGWARISDMVHKYDEDRIRDVKEDIDTLLVFAGLFSAVLTAFLIETYTTLKADSGDATSEILLQISFQLASLTVAGSFINSTIPAFSIPSFVAPQSSVRINTLWSCSLAFALITASLAILVKQWFHEYMSHESQSPLSHLRLRFFRHDGLMKWRVFQLAAALPLLLQLALLLFFVGFGEFLLILNPVVGWITTGVMLVWLSVFIFTTLAPIFSPQCPYRTPMLKDFIRTFRSYRGYIIWIPILVGIWIISSPTLIPLYLLGYLPFRRFFPTFKRWAEPKVRIALPWFTWISPPWQMETQYEEQEVRRSSFSDFAILSRSKSLFQDEQLDGTINQCTQDFDLISALTCIRTYLPQSSLNKISSVTPTKAWMTHLPREAEESFFNIFEAMHLGRFDCQGVDITKDAPFEQTYESLTSLIKYTAMRDVQGSDFYFGSNGRTPHFPTMFMNYMSSGDISLCALFMALYTATADFLDDSVKPPPWRVICGSLRQYAGNQGAPKVLQTAFIVARAFLHRAAPLIFDIQAEERRASKVDPYIRALIVKHKIVMNPLALAYTFAMFTLVASNDAIYQNSLLTQGIPTFTTELWVATRDDLDNMKTDDCWRDCALQTVQALRRIRKLCYTSVNSRLFEAIDKVRKSLPELDFSNLDLSGIYLNGFDLEAENIPDREIFDPTVYVYLKEPWATEFRREFGVRPLQVSNPSEGITIWDMPEIPGLSHLLPKRPTRSGSPTHPTRPKHPKQPKRPKRPMPSMPPDSDDETNVTEDENDTNSVLEGQSTDSHSGRRSELSVPSLD